MKDISTRYSTVDVLKGVAILFVIFNHYAWSEEQRLIPFFPYIINMAVPVFMMISGYVLTASLEHRNIESLSDCYDRNILIKRFLRYSVPYFIICFWEILDPFIDIGKGSILEYIRWVINGTEGQGSYYYPLLIQLITAFPLIFFTIRKKRKNGLIICFFINAVYEILVWSYGVPEDIYRLLVFRYTFLLAAGAYAYYESLPIRSSIILSVFGAAFITLTTYLGYQTRIIKYWTNTCFISTMMVVPTVSYLIRLTTLTFHPLELIGRASYNIYLVQLVFFFGYSGRVYRFIDNIWLRLLIVMVFNVILGILFYFIEAPFTKKLTTILTKRPMRREGSGDHQTGSRIGN